MNIIWILAFIPLSILAAIGLYFLAMLIGYFIPVNSKYKQSVEGIDIFFSTNGMHIDIIVPACSSFFDWKTILPNTGFVHSLKAYEYLAIGWGDYGFYLELEAWDKLTADIALKALFKPNTPTLMHITGYKKLPYEGYKIAKLTVSRTEYEKLCSYIIKYFQTDSTGKPILVADRGYTEHDNFYKAKGSYSALHTCNYWVSKGLRKSGIRTALWSPLERGVFYHFEQLNAVIQPSNTFT